MATSKFPWFLIPSSIFLAAVVIHYVSLKGMAMAGDSILFGTQSLIKMMENQLNGSLNQNQNQNQK